MALPHPYVIPVEPILCTKGLQVAAIHIPPDTISLPEGHLWLLSDVILGSGRSLTLRGSDTIIFVGERWLHVQPGGRLDIESIRFHGSVGSSAMVIRGGDVTVVRSGFEVSNARHNVQGIDDTTGAASLDSYGGSVFMDGGSLKLQSSYIRNSSITDGQKSAGGAVFARNNASIVVQNSTLEGCSASTSAGLASGGGLFLRASRAIVDGSVAIHNRASALDAASAAKGGFLFAMNSQVRISGTLIEHNQVTRRSAYSLSGAMTYGGACHLTGPASDLLIEDSTFKENVVHGGSTAGLVQGGAVDTTRTTVTVRRSKFERNSVSGSLFWCAGGALSISLSDAVLVEESEITGNSVSDSFTRSGSDAQAIGGGIYVEMSTTHVLRTVFGQNSVSGASRSASGGAVLVWQGAIRIEQSSFIANMAQFGNQFSRGGAIGLENGILLAQLVVCEFVDNVA
jgi:hypothetical protein